MQKRGYEVKLIPPQHVKPFVKGNKTDRLLAHRRRERAVGARTRLVNQMRGLLQEYGVVVAQGKGRCRPCWKTVSMA